MRRSSDGRTEGRGFAWSAALRRGLGVWLGALLFLVSAGCSSAEIALEVQTQPNTNGGRPFQVVVRSVPSADFATDTYEAIAQLPFARPADKSVLASAPVFPGVEKEIVVPKTDRYPLAVYLLFTEPADGWKALIPQPLPDDAELEVGETAIVKVRY